MEDKDYTIYIALQPVKCRNKELVRKYNKRKNGATIPKYSKLTKQDFETWKEENPKINPEKVFKHWIDLEQMAKDVIFANPQAYMPK